MGFDVEAVREALGTIRDALDGAPLEEPVWLSQAERDRILLAEDSYVLEGQSLSDSDRGASLGDAGYTREVAEESGVEAIAWYRSFRDSGKPWGIYLRIDAIAALCDDMFATVAATRAEKCQIAIHALTVHERAHFAIDAAAAQYELLSRCALWYPRKRERAMRDGYDKQEEQIDKAAMLRGVRTMRDALRLNGRDEALRGWTRRQPDGYRTGYRLTPRDRFVRALDKHGAAIAERALPPESWRTLLRFAPLVEDALAEAQTVVPVYYVFSRWSMRAGDIGCFPAVRIVDETAAFLKQLDKQSTETKRAYAKLKARLSTSSPHNGHRMKRWPKEGKSVWSLRLNGGDRLHLQQLGGVEFAAIDIGSHKATGHG